VAALHEMCADGFDDEARVDRKKALSEHVRRLEDACDAADKQLSAIREGSGPAAFLLQRRRTVDDMTSLMTSQMTSATDWPVCERKVRFEAFGLNSALGLRVGRLVTDDEVSDVDAGSQLSDRDDVTSGRQRRVHSVTFPRVDNCDEWIEVKMSDMGVQTDEMDQSLTPSSRCEASGSVSASTTRLGVTGTSPTSTRRQQMSPTTAAAAASRSNEPVTSLCDASTSTSAVYVVSSSTVTDRLVTCDQSTYTDLSSAASHDQQTNTDPLPDVHHRATSTDLLETRSFNVTAAPTTTDRSTSTIHVHDPLCVSEDAHSEEINDDKNLTQTTSFATCSASTVSNASTLQTSENYTTVVDDAFVPTESPITYPQTTPAVSTFNVPRLSQAAASSAHLSTELKTDESKSVLPSLRLAALLPEISRTADVLAASHFSSGLTARLLRDIVDVGVQMTSSCGRHTRDAATDTTDHQTTSALNASPHRCDVKWTQTTAVCGDVVDVGIGQSVVTTSDASTLTKLMPMTFDKETWTARAHQVNRSVATDSLLTTDKQTWMPIDVTTAYLASTSAATRHALSVSRGTLTAPSQPLVDRATSPVRATLVDKSVMASKAEALEPVDTFQTAGQLSGPLSPRSRRPLSLSPRSKLACISESAEHFDEETAEDSDDVCITFHRSERFDARHTGSSQPGLTSTQPANNCMSTCLQQSDLLGQSSRNVFNFDHVVMPHFTTVSPGSLDDDNLVTSSSANDDTNPPSSVTETVAQSSTYDVLLRESWPPVDK